MDGICINIRLSKRMELTGSGASLSRELSAGGFLGVFYQEDTPGKRIPFGERSSRAEIFADLSQTSTIYPPNFGSSYRVDWILSMLSPNLENVFAKCLPVGRGRTLNNFGPQKCISHEGRGKRT